MEKTETGEASGLVKLRKIVLKILTAEERVERVMKELCFNCDESCAPGHKCKDRLFRMGIGIECLVEKLRTTGRIERGGGKFCDYHGDKRTCFFRYF